MKSLFVKISFLLIIFSGFSSASSQVLPYGCGLDEKNFPSFSGPAGKSNAPLPSSGTVKVLIIYCKFIDDYFDYPPYSDQWPGDSYTLPAWTSKTVSRSTQEISSHPGVTGYFEDMSRGKLKVIGDVCPVLIIPRLPSYYYSREAGSDITYLTKEVLDKADPYVNYSDYDNYDPNDYNHNGIYNERDGVADMIIICFRTIPIGISNIDDLGNYSGIASLTGSHDKFPGGLSEIIKDGVRIKAGILGSGTFQHSIFDLHGQLHIMAHEIGHYLFINSINHLYGTGYYTLMSGIGCGVMSAFEREQLGWMEPGEVKKNMYNAALPDVISSGVAYKIPIANPPYNFPLHLYVENFQSSSYYVREWLRWNGGPKTIQNTGVIISEANSSVYLSEIKCADGKWNWDRRLYIWHSPGVIKDWLYTYPFYRLDPDPDKGDNEMNLLGLRYDRNDFFSTIDHPNALGDANDFFNVNYNDVYSEWSNPNLYPYGSANLCVELTRKDFSTIYANFYVEGNTPVQAKPSKPQLWKIEKVNGNQPEITWLGGREPDLAGYYVYRKKSINGSWENIAGLEKTAESYIDEEPAGDTVFYKIRSYDTDGKLSCFSDVLSTGDGEPSKPGSETSYNFSLSQNYPNPFNPETNISFTLPVYSRTKLIVYDVLGREVYVIFDGLLSAGEHSFKWNGAGYPSGVYFYRLDAGALSISRKMILVK